MSWRILNRIHAAAASQPAMQFVCFIIRPYMTRKWSLIRSAFVFNFGLYIFVAKSCNLWRHIRGLTWPRARYSRYILYEGRFSIININYCVYVCYIYDGFLFILCVYAPVLCIQCIRKLRHRELNMKKRLYAQRSKEWEQFQSCRNKNVYVWICGKQSKRSFNNALSTF